MHFELAFAWSPPLYNYIHCDDDDNDDSYDFS